MSTRHASADTALGQMTVVASGDAIVGVYFERHWTMPPLTTIGSRVKPGDDALIEAAWAQLNEYLEKVTAPLPEDIDRGATVQLSVRPEKIALGELEQGMVSIEGTVEQRVY